MSTTEIKRDILHATADAEAFRRLFPQVCWERWEFAGSIRRRRQEISDVEHIIIPRHGDVGTGGLFDEKQRINLLWHRAEELLAAGLITKHVYGGENAPTSRWGPKYRGCDFRGINHEIWLADANNWGSVLAIRTGPADLSRNLVVGLRAHGYINQGGYVRDMHRWKCACGWSGPAPYAIEKKPAAELAICPGCRSASSIEAIVIPCADEREFFRMAGITYVPPEAR